MLTQACSRCSKLVTVLFDDDDGPPDPDKFLPEGGIILVVCSECMTDEEVFSEAERGAAALLDAAEEMIASLDMIARRVPGIAEDNLEFKAARSLAEDQAARAAAALDALRAARRTQDTEEDGT